MSAVAAARGTERAVVLPKGWPAPSAPLSHGVRAGDTLFLSGLVPRRGADNTPVKGDIEAQTHAVFDNAEAILAAAGLDARRRRLRARVSDRRRRVRPHERRLPDPLPASAARPGHGDHAAGVARLPDRDHDGGGAQARSAPPW